MNKIPECLIHPISIKLIRQGHPWVTPDNFSNRFPKQSEFIIAVDDRKKPLALLLHDPHHKNVKARVWATSNSPDKNPFEKEAQHFTASLQARLDQAFERRTSAQALRERENFYLCFGEADQLPGIFILRLKDRILIQLYSSIWNNYRQIIQTTILEIFPEMKEEDLWFQLRGETRELQKLPTNAVDPSRRDEFHLQEFGIQYLVRLGSSYDHGLYTDMSSVRHALQGLLPVEGSVLNLYCYTGAFSLWAMKLGARQVTSVDLSPKYIEWLQQNLGLNPELESKHHEALTMSVEDALVKLRGEQRKFDFIICDPPSSSSDGEKRTSAIRSYKDLISKMDKVLEAQGRMVIFLNTHQVNQLKFERTIQEILGELKLKYKLLRKLTLAEDCPTLKGFPEGSYLKGLVLEKL